MEIAGNRAAQRLSSLIIAYAYAVFLRGYSKNDSQNIVYAYVTLLQGETSVPSVPMPWFFQTYKNRFGFFFFFCFCSLLAL
jgi:hypothetical protein